MKIAGVIFIVLSATSVGFTITMSMRKRCILIRQLLGALQLLKNEIVFCGTPLPQAFALMAASTDGMLAEFFSKTAKTMDKYRWITPYAAIENALKGQKEIQEGDPLRAILLELAGKLGKYDTENQLQGLELALIQLNEERKTAEQERKLRGKTYETLGICAGLAIAILLI